MARLLFRFGRVLMVSRRRKQVRSSLVFLFTAFIRTAAVVFSLEIVLIALGTAEVTLPPARRLMEVISRIAF